MQKDGFVSPPVILVLSCVLLPGFEGESSNSYLLDENQLELFLFALLIPYHWSHVLVNVGAYPVCRVRNGPNYFLRLFSL